MTPGGARRAAGSIGLCAATLVVPAAVAEPVEGFGFHAAAQEISQLFWLAETANVCGWASAAETLKFKQFSVRFLAAHLSERYVRALANLVEAKGYESGLRRAAEESSPLNCGAARWRDGWLAYKAAADEHEHRF